MFDDLVITGLPFWPFTGAPCPALDCRSGKLTHPLCCRTYEGGVLEKGSPGARVIEEVMAGASGSPVNYLEGTANLKQVPTA